MGMFTFTNLKDSFFFLIYFHFHVINIHQLSMGFPGGTVVKNQPANVGDVGLIPGSGRSPGGGHGNPLQYSCLENPMDRGAWWGHKESNMTS